MRDRLRTPYFFMPGNLVSSHRGVESPPGEVPARALVGQVVGNGRYLLRQKTGHSTESVSYEALDMVGGIDVTVELHPDRAQEAGYRLGGSDAVAAARGLPNLYADPTSPGSPRPGARPGPAWWGRGIWRALRSAFRRR